MVGKGVLGRVRKIDEKNGFEKCHVTIRLTSMMTSEFLTVGYGRFLLQIRRPSTTGLSTRKEMKKQKN